MLRKTPREKLILGIVLILFIGFLLYQSLIAMQIVRLKAIDFQFTSQKKLLDFYSRIMKQINVLMSEAKEEEGRLAQIKEKFVEEAELSNYFSNFRALVKSYNLSVASLDFKPQEAIEGLNKKPLAYYQRLPLKVSLRGSYFNIMFLLYNLERASPIFDIQSMRIGSESPDSYEIVIDMEAAIYILMRKS